MTEEESHRHLKDCLFQGLKPNLRNALCYLYDKPDSQYSQLVMTSRKAKTETLRRSVSEVRVKSAVIGADVDSSEKGASSEPLFEVIMQQITYLMCAVANQTIPNLNKMVDAQDSNPMGMVGTLPLHFRDPNGIERT